MSGIAAMRTLRPPYLWHLADDRVFLRAPAIEDSGEFLARVRDSRGLHHPWVTPPASPDTFAAYVARASTAEFQGFLICRRSDGALVGVANLSQIARGLLQSAYLGYYGFVPFVRQGYITEGVGQVVSRAFGALALHRVEANVQPENLPSKAVVQRLGFRLEGFSPRYLKIAGRWRDHERWAMLSDEWRGRESPQG